MLFTKQSLWSPALTQLGPTSNDTREKSFEELNESMNQWAVHGRAYHMNAATIQALSPTNCLKIAQGQHEMLQRLSGAGSIVHAELFPPSATESVPTEAMAFAQRTTGRQVVAKIIWDDQEFPIETVRDEMQRFLAIIEERPYVAPLPKPEQAYSITVSAILRRRMHP